MKIIIFAIVFLSVIDILWITINKSRYNSMVRKVQGSQGTSMKINMIGALVAYTLMFAGLAFIVFPLCKNDKTTKNKLVLALKYGAVFGLILYGVYNSTNFAIFANYDPMVACIDTLWGTFAYFITTYVTLLLFSK